MRASKAKEPDTTGAPAEAGESDSSDVPLPTEETSSWAEASDENSKDSSIEDAPDDSEVGKSLQKVSKEMIPAEEGRPTELIQHDGKWILRDLVTNREVEISPIEAQSHGAIVEDAPEEVVATPVKDDSDELEGLEAPNIFAEFFLFLKEEKIWWMAPMLVVLLLVGALLIFGQSAPALAPFIYPLF
jgi:hypothetical protein